MHQVGGVAPRPKGMGSNTIKTHPVLHHLSEDILDHGVLDNVNSAYAESAHIPLSKITARNTQNVQQYLLCRRPTGSSKTLQLRQHGKTCSRMSWPTIICLLVMQLVEWQVTVTHLQHLTMMLLQHCLEHFLAEDLQSHWALVIRAQTSFGIVHIPLTIPVVILFCPTQCASLGDSVCPAWPMVSFHV